MTLFTRALVIGSLVGGLVPQSTWLLGAELFPALPDSPVAGFESQMPPSPVGPRDSQMMDSPLDRIGSPFGPYRFSTLPSAEELAVTRRSLPLLPATLREPHGALLLLPSYTLPQPLVLTVQDLPQERREEPDPIGAPPPRASTILSRHCGRFIQLPIPDSGSLAELEDNLPCP